MTDLLRITAVSYANTYPFVYGIERSGILKNYKLLLNPPSQCVTSFENTECDIALVPVGAIPRLKAYNIITDLCIGAVNEVKSVLLVSNKPINEIRSIGLDRESETSVRLTKVLSKHFWNINPEWNYIDVRDFAKYSDVDAFTVIGDKAFEIAPHFTYNIDLAVEWRQYTNLPFVFAVWMSHENVSEDSVGNLSEALQFGINHIDDVVAQYSSRADCNIDLKSYLTNNIDYRLDEVKRRSLKKFLNYIDVDEI